jgi:hypothetical protein
MLKSLVTLLLDPNVPSFVVATAILGNECNLPMGFRILMFGFALSGLNLGLVIQRCLRQ